MHGDTTALHDMSLRELSHWAEGQAKRLAANFGLDSAAESDNAYFALAQTVKLGIAGLGSGIGVLRLFDLADAIIHPWDARPVSPARRRVVLAFIESVCDI
jgi:hypothetical protein